MKQEINLDPLKIILDKLNGFRRLNTENINILSEIGSNIFPNSVTIFNFLANKPSKISVIDANKKTQKAICNLLSNIIIKIIGTEKSLKKDIIFAIFIIFTLLNLAFYYLNRNLNQTV